MITDHVQYILYESFNIISSLKRADVSERNQSCDQRSVFWTNVRTVKAFVFRNIKYECTWRTTYNFLCFFSPIACSIERPNCCIILNGFLKICQTVWFMECAIGRASRAMALPDFKLVGPAIHLALPNFFFKLSTSKYFH